MKFLLGVLLAILLAILAVVLIVSGGSSDKPKTPVVSKQLIEYANQNSEVSMTIDGPVNSPEEHQQVQISVSGDTISYSVMKGYDGDVAKSKTYSNTRSSYKTFLKTLGHLGFTLGDPTKELQDERGYCPTASRYIFKLNDGKKDVFRYWTSSCGKPKTYQGNGPLTVQLFKDQVPQFDELESPLQ